MTLDFLQDYYIPVVLAACLVVGYIMKKWLPSDNKYIPTTVTMLGAVLGCIANGSVTLEAVVAGMVTGLASTGMHQLFKQIIEDDDE